MSIPTEDELMAAKPDEAIGLTASGDGYSAICGPWLDPDGIDDIHYDGYNAPFPFLVHETDDCDVSYEEVASELSAEFDDIVTSVYERLDNSDDPLETILEMEPEEIYQRTG